MEENIKFPQIPSRDRSVSFEIDSLALLKELHHTSIGSATPVNHVQPMASLTRESSLSLGGNGSEDRNMEEESEEI